MSEGLLDQPAAAQALAVGISGRHCLPPSLKQLQHAEVMQWKAAVEEQ
jgi:hypothetical protein